MELNKKKNIPAVRGKVTNPENCTVASTRHLYFKLIKVQNLEQHFTFHFSFK